MKSLLYIIICVIAFVLAGCSQDAPPEGAAVRNREQLPVMVSYGVSKLISDSGVTRYKIITEEWAVYDQTNPPRQDFLKGILMLRFDKQMNVDMQIVADTAYWYNQNFWELRGRVYVENLVSKTTYRSNQLFWDMGKHEFYSNVWMHITTPEREVQGTSFKSNEQMTRFEVNRDKGTIPMPKEEKQQGNDSTKHK